MKHFECDIPLAPIPKGRPRFWQGRAITPPETRRYEMQITCLIRAALGPRLPMQGAVAVHAVFFLEPPKRSTHGYPSRGDLDNFLKAVLDSANGLVWKDDSQITRLEAEKRYGPPGIRFSATEIEPL